MEQTKESSGTDPRKQQTMIYICGGMEVYWKSNDFKTRNQLNFGYLVERNQRDN